MSIVEGRTAAWAEVMPPSGEAGGPDRPPSRLRVFLRGAVPPVVVAGLLTVLGRERAALVVLALGVGIAVASTVSPSFRARMERVLARVGHSVGHGITVVLMAIVEGLVFLPLSLLFRAFRHDPLTFGRQRRSQRAAGGWRPHPDRERRVTQRQPYGIEPVPPEPTGWRRPLRRAPRWIGAAALLVLVDLAVGSLWYLADDPSETVSPASEQLEAATADDPWFEDYRAEVEALSYEFTPFVINTPDDVEGRYVNIVDGVRRSYQPAEGGDGVPTVWVFGGTNVWGEGQRDEHTLPSELARAAEAAGAPIRVVNFGQRGDVGFGAMLRLERALAATGPRPDLVVLADGPDDYAVQRAAPSSQPTHHGVEVTAREVQRRDERSLLQRYRDVSLVQRAVTRLQSLVPVLGAQPAHAQATDPAGSPADERGDAPVDLAVADDLAAIYERGRLMALDLAVAHDVEVVHAWLPVDASGRWGTVYSRATDQLDPSVIDLSDALDDDDGAPVYLDGFRMTEHGARLVAAALYDELRTRTDALGGA